MKYLKIIIFTFSIVFISNNVSQAQNIFKIYKDDSLELYFKERGNKNGFFFSINNLRDTLPDGKYIFYNVSKKDSLSKHKEVWIECQYVSNQKSGKFEETNYRYPKRKKAVITYKHICYYKSGEKEGIEEEYMISDYNGTKLKVFIFFGEYKKGLKDGVFIYFTDGYPSKVVLYRNGIEEKILIE